MIRVSFAALFLVAGMSAAASAQNLISGSNRGSGTSSQGVSGGSSSGTTNSYANQTGFTGQNASSNSGFSSGISGSSGFVGSTNTGFTGNRSASNASGGMNGGAGSNGVGAGTSNGGLSRSSMGSMSSFSGGANQFSRSRGGQNGQNGQNRNGLGAAQAIGTYTSRAVRPQQKVAFQHPIRPVEQIGSSVTATYVRTGNPSFKGLDVAINGEGTMTLKGEVPDADAMALAIAMARLEPGVRNVDNQLTVPNQTYNPGTEPVNQRNP